MTADRIPTSSFQMGICNSCGEKVQLVYEGGNPLKSLVVGTHSKIPIATGWGGRARAECPGAGRPPRKYLSTE